MLCLTSRDSNEEVADGRDEQQTATGHRKAVPDRANHVGTGESSGARPDDGVALTSGVSEGGPSTLAVLLRTFIDRLGYSGCVEVSVASQVTPPHSKSKSRHCCVEGKVPGLGVLRLERRQEDGPPDLK